jgi:hypothetical protein
VHTKADQRLQEPSRAQDTLQATASGGTAPTVPHIAGEKARPCPAGRPLTSGRDVAMGDVVHRPSRLASLSAPLNHTPGHPAARRRRTIKLSSETRLLTTNVLSYPRPTNLC